jgi:hypothetical protein
MRGGLRRTIAVLVAGVLVPGGVPAWASSSAAEARLEGLLLDLDGRPARGYRVYLIDAQGREKGAAVTAHDGRYSLARVAPGRYAVGIENPDGAIAPVAAPPVRVRPGMLLRRDLRLVQAEPIQVERALVAHHGFRLWWASRSKKEKAGWTAGAVVGVGLLWYLFRDDDEERVSSPDGG